MSKYIYPGKELELFSQAKNWKRYFSKVIEKYIQGDVLEVGAGIGETTFMINSSHIQSWICIEPDNTLFKRLQENLKRKKDKKYTCLKGTIDTLKGKKFDTIIYVDVLEHIKDDKSEIKKASIHLKKGGSLIVISPAHNFLYSPFDKQIGHYRRYDKKNIRSLTPNELRIGKIKYLDSAGILASLGNKMLLKKNMPNLKNILIWDRILVPISKILDVLTFHKIGKTIVVVWFKN